MFGEPSSESKYGKIKFSSCSNNLTKGPFGSDMKKSLYVQKSATTYKVYLQINAIQKDITLGDYYISEEYFQQKMFKYEVKPGDFIITCDGTLGELIQVNEPMEKGVISSSLMRVTLDESKLEVKYFEFLWKHYMLPIMERQTRNSCLLHLPSAKVLGEIEIPLPPMPIQKTFTDFVRQTDKSKYIWHNALNANCVGGECYA